MRLEPELWEALAEICARERQDINHLVRQIEGIGHDGGRTSAVRVFVLQYFRAAASESGHLATGHGCQWGRSRSPASRGTPLSRGRRS
jgi:predicted DNA-binding ribbon-helix-helix protein